MSLRSFALSLAVTAAAAPVVGAAAEPAMTLAEALDYARLHQPSLVGAHAERSAAEAVTNVVTAAWFPRLTAAAEALTATANNTTATVLGAPGIDLPRIGATPVGRDDLSPHPTTLAVVGLRQEVFDFGRLAAASAVADAALAFQRGREREVELDVALGVEEAYYAVHAARGVLAAATGARERARLARETAAAAVGAGLRKPVELTRAEAELARAEVDRLRAVAALTIAKSSFAAVVGVPDPTLDAAGEPPPIAAAPPLERAVEAALAADPQLREARARLAEQSAVTRAFAANNRPDLQLTGAFSVREGGAVPSSGPTHSGWRPDTANWDVGLVLSIPLFDAPNRAREEVGHRLELSRQADIDGVDRHVRAAVQDALVRLDAAAQALPALEKSLVAARANYDQADARFNAGLGTAIELSDAQTLLTDSEVQLALGRFEHARARARLGRVIAEGT